MRSAKEHQRDHQQREHQREHQRETTGAHSDSLLFWSAERILYY